MNYQDLIYAQCGDNNPDITMQEVEQYPKNDYLDTLIYKKIISDQIYQCISNKTYSLDEMQVGLYLGAAASAKGNIHFRIRDVMEHLEFSFD